MATTNNPHPLTDATGSRRYICIEIPDGQFIDNSGEIDHEQLYAQVLYELREQKSPYWFSNDEVARIQQMNLEYQDEKDMAEIVEACFRKPKEGETVKAMNCGDILRLIRKEYPSVKLAQQVYPSVKATQSNKIQMGLALKEMGFESTTHAHMTYYKVVFRKSA